MVMVVLLLWRRVWRSWWKSRGTIARQWAVRGVVVSLIERGF